MSSFLDKLNLRPQERRLVVLVGLIVFVVLNVWFVRPHFKDWQQLRVKISQAEKNLKAAQAEIGRVPEYEAKLKELQSTGSDILSQELQLQRIVQSQAVGTGVFVKNYFPNPRGSGVSTNRFFEEQSLSIDVQTGAKELVNFLVNLAAANSMIRVREMNLKPDPSQTKLVGTILFVANYQKQNAAAKPRVPAKTAPTTLGASTKAVPPAKAGAPMKSGPTAAAAPTKAGVSNKIAAPTKAGPTAAAAPAKAGVSNKTAAPTKAGPTAAAAPAKAGVSNKTAAPMKAGTPRRPPSAAEEIE